VIAGCDDVSAEVEDIVGDFRSDAEAPGGVFAIDDDEVNVVIANNVGQVLAHDAATCAAEYVSYKKNAHLGEENWMLPRRMWQMRRTNLYAKKFQKGRGQNLCKFCGLLQTEEAHRRSDCATLKMKWPPTADLQWVFMRSR
jgi:hypothetical protein